MQQNTQIYLFIYLLLLLLLLLFNRDDQLINWWNWKKTIINSSINNFFSNFIFVETISGIYSVEYKWNL